MDFINPLCFYNPLDDNSVSCSYVNYLDKENTKIFSKLVELLSRDYFRFYKVNLKKTCPFWPDNSHCTLKYCGVEFCDETTLPPALRAQFNIPRILSRNISDCEDYDAELGFLNTSISSKIKKDINAWEIFDDSVDNFCVWNDDDEEAVYVDLLLNPEGYTGFKGKSAHKIWNTIYKENCFSAAKEKCTEERFFYNIISGLHASINIHLCNDYFTSSPSNKEFIRRFSPDTTNEQGPQWIKNLYFLYLIELGALEKASHILEKEEYFTGNINEDIKTQKAVKDLIRTLNSFKNTFNLSFMFSHEDVQVKNQIKMHFRNISLIMDCVGCDKCKLWGKVQTHGLGTALKILFSPPTFAWQNFRYGLLRRAEIVSLVNSLARLSTSIYKLQEYRNYMQNHLVS